MRFLFKASNNEAEYESLLAGIGLCQTAGAKLLRAFSDSQLVVEQIKGEFEARETSMIAYLKKVKLSAAKFEKFEIEHVNRSENHQADALSKLASSTINDTPRIVFWEVLPERSIEKEEVSFVDRSETWMGPIIEYLVSQTLPDDPKEAEAVK